MTKKNIHFPLVKSKEEIMGTIELILEGYESQRTIFNRTPEEAKKRTMTEWQDFYEWLIGNLK